MKKIETLTKEQESKLSTYRDKWLAIGLSTEETDIEAAESAMNAVYECAGLTPPEQKIWARNPYEGAVLAAQLAKYGEIRSGDELSKTEITSQLNQAGYGSHDASWLSFYDFFQQEAGINLEKVNGLIKLAQQCGWWWAFESTVVMTPKPNFLATDEQGRLHREDGAALSYADGWSLYCWHGIRVSERLIKNPESYTVEEVLNEGNAEIRRCMTEKIGLDIFQSEASLVCEDEIGKLYRLSIEGDEDLSFVQVINSSPEPDGTFKSYSLRVPPTVETPKEGIAWTFQKEESEYIPIKQT